MTEPVEHMEHAHHNRHVQDPFDKRVAATMAVIAVILAVTALLSHAANNETLAKQVESAKTKTEATDQWALFQAKKNRAHTNEAMLAMVRMTIAAREATATRPAEAATLEHGRRKGRYEEDALEAQKLAREFEEESESRAGCRTGGKT